MTRLRHAPAGDEPAEGIGENGGWARSTRLAESLRAAGDGDPLREPRLVRCGCALRFSHLFGAVHFALVRQAYRIADRLDASSRRRPGVETDPLTELVADLAGGPRRGDYLFRLLSLVGGRDREAERAAEVAAQEAVVRDVFGDPHRHDVIEAGWLTSNVVGVARHVYESGDSSAMPVLADALEDAGCRDAAVLDHCRAAAPHVRGCWVVDGVLRFRSAEARIRRRAMTDSLTELPSRRAFFLALRGALLRALKTASPTSVLCIDMDNFRRLNHRLTHIGGDRVLRGVASLLLDALDGDGVPARVGGDRFGVVLPSTDLAAAVEVGERLRRAAETWRWAAREGGPREEVVTISVGAAANIPGMAAGGAEDLWEAADSALARAKEAGRNRVSV